MEMIDLTNIYKTLPAATSKNIFFYILKSSEVEYPIF